MSLYTAVNSVPYVTVLSRYLCALCHCTQQVPLCLMSLYSAGTSVPYVHIIVHKHVMLDTLVFECQLFLQFSGFKDN
jgi:hypothetical protein